MIAAAVLAYLGEAAEGTPAPWAPLVASAPGPVLASGSRRMEAVAVVELDELQVGPHSPDPVPDDSEPGGSTLGVVRWPVHRRPGGRALVEYVLPYGGVVPVEFRRGERAPYLRAVVVGGRLIVATRIDAVAL